MDWTTAIDRNRDALLRMLAATFVMAGGGVVSVLPRCVRTEIFRVLRPAEAALRRLVVIVKEDMGLQARVVARAAAGFPARISGGSGERAPGFVLFDRRKRFEADNGRRLTAGEPNIRFFDGYDAVIAAKSVALPDDLVNAVRLCRRMRAMRLVLDDLPKQARRLARWEAKRASERAETGRYIRPMRPGRPPGHRARGKHPVDFVLRDCHALALFLLHPP